MLFRLLKRKRVWIPAAFLSPLLIVLAILSYLVLAIGDEYKLVGMWVRQDSYEWPVDIITETNERQYYLQTYQEYLLLDLKLSGEWVIYAIDEQHKELEQRAGGTWSWDHDQLAMIGNNGIPTWWNRIYRHETMPLTPKPDKPSHLQGNKLINHDQNIEYTRYLGSLEDWKQSRFERLLNTTPITND